MFKNARLFNQDLSTWNTAKMVDSISPDFCWWSRYNCKNFALNSGCPGAVGETTCGVVFDKNCKSDPDPYPPLCPDDEFIG